MNVIPTHVFYVNILTGKHVVVSDSNYSMICFISVDVPCPELTQ